MIYSNLSVSFSKTKPSEDCFLLVSTQAVRKGLMLQEDASDTPLTQVCKLSTENTTSDVDGFIQSVFDQFDVFQVIFNDANQVAQAFLLLFQVLLDFS